MTEFLFREKLTETDIVEVCNFYNERKSIFVDQHPLWEINGIKNTDKLYLIAREQNKITGYAKIIIKRFGSLSFIRYAEINKGPVFSNTETAIECIKRIVHECKTRGCMYCSFQLGIPVSNESEFIEMSLQRDNYKFATYFNRFNLSTILIDLSKDIEEIKKDFSENLRRNLKKSIANNITVRKLESDDDFNNAIQLCLKMVEIRKLNDYDSKTLEKIVLFVRENKCGLGLGTFKEDGIMIGGAIIIFQGNRAEYYLGFSDPNEKLPALHALFLEAMIISKNRGFYYFDLGGYGHYAKEGEQVFQINKFKTAFSKSFIFYPKRMHFVFKPNLLIISKILAAIKIRIRN